MPVAAVESSVIVGPETRKLATRYFARFGDWPISLRLILGGRPIPKDIVESGERLRKVWQREELLREAREKLDGTDKMTLTLTVMQKEDLGDE